MVPVSRHGPDAGRWLPASEDIGGVSQGRLVIDKVPGEEDDVRLEASHLLNHPRMKIAGALQVQVRDLDCRHPVES